jgi:hypothetical protein
MRFSGPLLAPPIGLDPASIAVLGNIQGQCHKIYQLCTGAVVVTANRVGRRQYRRPRDIQSQCQKILRRCLGAVVVAAYRVGRCKYPRPREYTGTVSEDS